MIEFLKNIIRKINSKSDNEELNKYNKIIYGAIILCAIFFAIFILVFIVKNWSNFIGSVQTNWNDSYKEVQKNVNNSIKKRWKE